MRYFFRRHLPPSSRILLIESGSRHLVEGVIPLLRAGFGEAVEIDLITCYPGAPRGCNGQIFRVGEYGGGAAGRKRLLTEMATRDYRLAGMICSAEPIMTKWKWMLAARLPGKVFVVNENGDYFWMDHANLAVIRYFILFRAGLTGSGAVRTLARVVLFPFSLLYLILYALTVHLRRILRTQ